MVRLQVQIVTMPQPSMARSPKEENWSCPLGERDPIMPSCQPHMQKRVDGLSVFMGTLGRNGGNYFLPLDVFHYSKKNDWQDVSDIDSVINPDTDTHYRLVHP